jgi:hypothetical protein
LLFFWLLFIVFLDRIAHNEYPWPDNLTRCCRRVGRRCCDNCCVNNCARCFLWCCCWWRDDGDCCTRRRRANTPQQAPDPLPNRNSLSISRGARVIETQPDTPIHVPSHVSETARINSLSQQAEMLDQMNEILNLMETLERMEREKKESKASEVTTPLANKESGGLIQDNVEDPVDLEYEEHRVRLQMLIDRMYKMNESENNKENIPPPVTLPKEPESPSANEHAAELSVRDIILNEIANQPQAIIAKAPSSTELTP